MTLERRGPDGRKPRLTRCPYCGQAFPDGPDANCVPYHLAECTGGERA